MLAALGCDQGGLRYDEPTRLVGSTPTDGARDVNRSGPFRLRFDHRLAPATVHRGTVTLRSGSVTVLLSVRYDPVAREIVTTPFTGRPLVENVEYTLRAEGMRDLDGVRVEAASVRFVTGDAIDGDYVVGSTDWEEVAVLFATRCVDGCHGGEDPSLGLDLSSPEAVRRTALGVPAVQTGDLDGVPLRGLGGMPIVDVLPGGGRPATSYLLYKMLGDDHVSGDPMPPDGARIEDSRLVADWILAGAPTE